MTTAFRKWKESFDDNVTDSKVKRKSEEVGDKKKGVGGTEANEKMVKDALHRSKHYNVVLISD